MLQKIRSLFKQDDSVALKGTVECDEVYIGGKEKWKHMCKRTPNTQCRSTKAKTPVFGMMERTTIKNKKGKKVPFSIVRAMVVEKTDGATLLPIISQFVEQGSTVMTDELNSYNGLVANGYKHEYVKHKESQFSFGDVCTNGIEGFWSHFRRMIMVATTMSVTSTCKRILTRRVSVGIQEKRPKWNASLICSLCLLVL